MDASHNATLIERLARSGSRGQVLPLVALMLFVLIGAASLAVDVGSWRYQERIEQSAADSAAIAAASELSYNAGANVTAAANADATLNGFTDDLGVTTNVHVNHPPSTGSYSANASAVEVVIEKKQSGFFTHALGLNPQWVSVRAVALAGGEGRSCIFGLQPTGTSVTINGSTVNTPRCGIISDSSMIVNGATVTARFIGFAAPTATDNGSTYPNGAHPTHSLPAADPCPSIPGCAYVKAHPPNSGTCQTPTSYTGGSTATFQPGHYCAAIVVTGTTNVVFNPGVYGLDSGMTLNGVTSVSGSGVTFYNASGSFIINGSTVNLTAPASGNTAGVLFFQTAADTNAFIANGSGGGYAGALYFPGANLTINGNLSSWLLLVGTTVTINGSGTNVPSAAFPGASRATLAE